MTFPFRFYSKAKCHDKFQPQSEKGEPHKKIEAAHWAVLFILKTNRAQRIEKKRVVKWENPRAKRKRIRRPEANKKEAKHLINTMTKC